MKKGEAGQGLALGHTRLYPLRGWTKQHSLGFANVDGVRALWTFTNFEFDGVSVADFTGHL